MEQKPFVCLLDRIITVNTAATDSPAAAPTAAVPSRLAAETSNVVITPRPAAMASAAAGPAAMASAAAGPAAMASAARTRTRVREEITHHQCYCRYSGV